MKVDIIGPNLASAQQRIATFHVHKEGCRDIERSFGYLSPVERDWFVEVVERIDVANAVYGPEAGSFYEEAGGDEEQGSLENYLKGCLTEFYFAPCVKELK